MNRHRAHFEQNIFGNNLDKDLHPFSADEIVAFISALKEVMNFLSKATSGNRSLATDIASWLGAQPPSKPQWNETAPRSYATTSPLSPKQIRATVTDDYIICLEDGTRVRSLRSKLRQFGLTPEQYKLKWGLPASYPMVAPALSALRSAVAQRTKPHLGKLKTKAPKAPEPASP